MTQNDKNILLKELCMRLPYGLRIRVDEKVETLEGVNVPDLVANYGGWCSSDIEEVKPYLLPLTSMTEELWAKEFKGYGFREDRTLASFRFDGETLASFTSELSLSDVANFINRLIKNHFDVNGLIPKGLALDATGLGIY